MKRYIDLSTLTEAVSGLHCPTEAEIPATWLELPSDHWFWQPMPAGCHAEVVDGVLELMSNIDGRTLETLRANVLGSLNAQADKALEPITNQYPRTEMDSWPEQCTEARAWLADQTAVTPLLDAIAGAVTASDKEAFCIGILSKADSYKGAVGAVIAWRRAVTDWIEQQQDRDALISFAPSFPEVPGAA